MAATAASISAIGEPIWDGQPVLPPEQWSVEIPLLPAAEAAPRRRYPIGLAYQQFAGRKARLASGSGLEGRLTLMQPAPSRRTGSETADVRFLSAVR